MKHGPLRTYGKTNKALEAQKKGHSFDKVFRRQERAPVAALKKSTMTRAQSKAKRQGKEAQERNGEEKVELADGHTGTGRLRIKQPSIRKSMASRRGMRGPISKSTTRRSRMVGRKSMRVEQTNGDLWRTPFVDIDLPFLTAMHDATTAFSELFCVFSLP
jgi:hypothetical protein